MRFYTTQHRFYGGVDLHARTMALHILDQAGGTVLATTLDADGRTFLDAIKPNNVKALLSLYRQVEAMDAPELIFTMMVKRLRQLMMLADGVTPDGLQGWQTKGLTNQARLFTIEKLLSMEKQLLDMEYSFKTGSSPFPLRQLIEQFLIEV